MLATQGQNAYQASEGFLIVPAALSVRRLRLALKRFVEGGYLEGTVADDVRWGDLVYALDALRGRVTFRP